MNLIDALNKFNARTYEINTVLPSIDDEIALMAPALFPKWIADISYNSDERVRYNDQLYKCVQSHTSQSDWAPDQTPSLWVVVAEPGTIPVWQQPTGAHDAYRINDKVHYPTKDDPIYICTIDYNIYPPDVSGWELYSNDEEITRNEALSILLGGTIT